MIRFFLILNMVFIPPYSSGAIEKLEVATGHGVTTSSGPPLTTENPILAYACTSTARSAPSSSIKGVLVRTNTVSKTATVAVIAENFRPSSTQSMGFKDFDIISGHQKLSGSDTPELLEEAYNAWASQKHLLSPVQEKNVHAVSFQFWDKPSAPEGSNQYLDTHSSPRLYFLNAFTYSGFFYFPEEAFFPETRNFSAQVFLRSDLAPNPANLDESIHFQKENEFQVECVSSEDDGTGLEELFLSLDSKVRLPSLMGPPQTGSDSQEPDETPPETLSEIPPEGQSALPDTSLLSPLSFAKVVGIHQAWLGLNNQEKSRITKQHWEAMQIIAGVGLLASASGAAKSLRQLVKHPLAKITLVAFAATTSAHGNALEEIEWESLAPEGCGSNNLFTNLQNMETPDLYSCVLRSQRLSKEMQLLIDLGTPLKQNKNL